MSQSVTNDFIVSYISLDIETAKTVNIISIYIAFQGTTDYFRFHLDNIAVFRNQGPGIMLSTKIEPNRILRLLGVVLSEFLKIFATDVIYNVS